jgi:hypothetical protein
MKTKSMNFLAAINNGNKTEFTEKKKQNSFVQKVLRKLVKSSEI